MDSAAIPSLHWPAGASSAAQSQSEAVTALAGEGVGVGADTWGEGAEVGGAAEEAAMAGCH